MSESPRVSVVIPTYERAEVLPRALESALSQTVRDLEVIVVDDGSTDDTPEVVRSVGDDRVRYERLDANRGANAARNRGIELGAGRFVSFLDSDDELHPRHLERVLATFEETGERCAGVFTAVRLVRDGRPAGVSRAPPGRLTAGQICADNVVGGFSCVTFRASIFGRVGRLDESLASSQDYDFFLRVVTAGHGLGGLDEVLTTCHLGEGRISDDPAAAREGVRRILEKHRDRLTDEGRSRLHYYRGFRHAGAGQMAAARRDFRRAIRCQPTRWLAYLHLAAAAHPAAFETLLSLKEAIRHRWRR